MIVFPLPQSPSATLFFSLLWGKPYNNIIEFGLLKIDINEGSWKGSRVVGVGVRR